MILFNSHLHVSPSKLRSPWFGPFIVDTIFPYRANKIKNPNRCKAMSRVPTTWKK